jgi:hypothetical protein
MFYSWKLETVGRGGGGRKARLGVQSCPIRVRSGLEGREEVVDGENERSAFYWTNSSPYPVLGSILLVCQTLQTVRLK